MKTLISRGFQRKYKKIAKKMGQNAREYTEKFDWKNTIPVLERGMEQVLENKKIKHKNL